eukprot:704856-Pyramimonas_sp.AAC.1
MRIYRTGAKPALTFGVEISGMSDNELVSFVMVANASGSLTMVGYRRRRSPFYFEIQLLVRR